MDLSTPTEIPLDPGMLDYTGSVGGFLFWSPKGQLFALDRFVVSRDFSRILPKVTSANFHAAYPLFSRMTVSNINLVLHPTQSAHAYFLMDIKTGPTSKKVKVLQAIQPMTLDEVAANVVRGQYAAGAVAGEPVPGYLEEDKIPSDSRNDTFIAPVLNLSSFFSKPKKSFSAIASKRLNCKCNVPVA